MYFTDLKILSLLQTEPTASNEKLGEGVGLSVSAVNERLKKLKKNQILHGWETRLNPYKLGFELLAFVYFLIERKEERLFLKSLARIPEVLECHHVTGSWTFLVKMRCKTLNDFETVLNDKIKIIPGIARSEILIALSTAIERSSLALDSIKSLPAYEIF